MNLVYWYQQPIWVSLTQVLKNTSHVILIISVIRIDSLHQYFAANAAYLFDIQTKNVTNISIPEEFKTGGKVFVGDISYPALLDAKIELEFMDKNNRAGIFITIFPKTQVIKFGCAYRRVSDNLQKS